MFGRPKSFRFHRWRSKLEAKSGDVVRGLISASPFAQWALLVGDLKLDLSSTKAVEALRSSAMASGVVKGSTLHDWSRVTSDALILARGEAEVEALVAVPSGSALRRWPHRA